MGNYSVNEFKDLIRKKVEEICKARHYNFDSAKDRHQAFNYFIASFYKDNNRYIDTEPEDGLMGETDDLRIDLYLEDSTDKSIYLIQGEYLGIGKKSSSAPMDEAKVVSFFNVHENLMDPKWVKKFGNKKAFSFLRDYKKIIEDDSYRVNYIFISTGKASDRIFNEVDKANKKYQKQELPIECQLYDFSEFKDFYTQAESIEASIPEKVDFSIPKDKMFIKEDPYRTVVVSIKANTIENLHRQFKDRLFAYNIRTYLGEKGINKNIVETAEEEPENFFYYNNGISAVCKNLKISGNKITAEKFQIINGAQTVGALRSIADSPKLEVLMRITETKKIGTEAGINEKIIRFNNTQNKITLSDFRSNDQIQLVLLNKFKTCTFNTLGNINYIRKRGDKFQRKGTYNLKLEDMAKIRFAYMHDPCTVISDANSLWKTGSGGNYKKTFGISNELVNVMTDETFIKNFLLPVVFYDDILKRCSEKVKVNEEYRYFKRFRYHFLYFYNLIKKSLESEKNIKANNKRLVDEPEYLQKFTNEIFEKISEKIADLYIDETDKDEYKNAPIRDLTINRRHKDKLEKKLLTSLPKVKI